MRGVTILRLLYILPLAVSPVAAAAAWKALFDTNAGWVNYFLGAVRLPQPNWLADPHTAMLSVVLADAWSGVSIITIIILGGLLSLSPEPTEAARIDGASETRILWSVTLPRIAPVVGFAMALRLFDLLRQFGLFQLMTGGGPGLTTNVLNFYVYQEPSRSIPWPTGPLWG
jgi:multiple sugar transport system permease protein